MIPTSVQLDWPSGFFSDLSRYFWVWTPFLCPHNISVFKYDDLAWLLCPVDSTVPSNRTIISNCSFIKSDAEKFQNGDFSLISCFSIIGVTKNNLSAPVAEPTSMSFVGWTQIALKSLSRISWVMDSVGHDDRNRRKISDNLVPILFLVQWKKFAFDSLFRFYELDFADAFDEKRISKVSNS